MVRPLRGGGDKVLVIKKKKKIATSLTMMVELIHKKLYKNDAYALKVFYRKSTKSPMLHISGNVWGQLLIKSQMCINMFNF